jgi:Fe(3+) dicitrate transport protein
LFAQEKNFQKKKKDSIESLNAVIITTDAIIGSKFNKKQSRFYLFYISKRIKTFNYDDVSRSKNSTRTNYSGRRWFWLTTKHWRNQPKPKRENNIDGRWGSYFTGTILCSAAYYFPTVSMQSFEILKGGSQIQYGPYTTGGAINMVSTQIPRRFQAVLLPA